MLASVTVTTASADTANLSDKAVTLSVTPSESEICVGSTGDVYVTYTISIEADVPIPAFQFRLPTGDAKLATNVQKDDPNWYYWFNTDELKQWDAEKETGGHGPYKVADYTKSSGYVGVGGSDSNGITEKKTVMTIVAKFENGSVNTTTAHTLKPTDFIAGGGETIDGTDGVKVSNAFGTRNVEGGSVTVKPGATISGTVTDSSGKAASGATVELYKDGSKVGTTATTDNDGKYTFSDVSTGTYTVKAKSNDGSLNGSDDVTVAAAAVTNANVTLSKGVTVSGAVTSYGSEEENITVTLTPENGTPMTTVVTGNSAAYKFENVSAGTYTLKVEKKGHAPWTEEITIDSAAITKDVTVYLWGDVNRDGKVNGTDALWVRQSGAGSRTLDAYQKVLADLNRDGKVNGTDVLWIRQIGAGSRTLTY